MVSQHEKVMHCFQQVNFLGPFNLIAARVSYQPSPQKAENALLVFQQNLAPDLV